MPDPHPRRVESAPLPAEDGNEAAPTTGRRLHWWFLVVAGLPGLALVFLVPVGKPPDEIAHLDRIWTMAHGHLVSDIRPDGDAGGAIPDCLSRYEHQTASNYVSVPALRLGSVLRADSSCARGEHDGQYASFGNSAVNSPVTYAPQSATVAALHVAGVSSVRTLVFAGRLAALAAYLALCALAIAWAPSARLVLFVVAGLPASLGLASTLSSDTLQLGLVVLVVALLLRVRAAPERSHRARVGLAGALLALVLAKNANAPFLLLWLAVPQPSQGPRWRRWARVGSVPVAGAAVGAAWAVLVRGITMFPPARVFRGVDPHGQLSWVLHHPFGFVAVLWRSVASMEFFGGIVPRVIGRYPSGRPGPSGAIHSPPVPALVIVAVLVAFVVALAAGWGPRRPNRTPWLPVLWAIVAGSSFVLVWLLVYAVSSPVAYPRVLLVQGRYFIPLLALLAPALDTWRFPRDPTDPRVRAATVAVPVLVGVALAAEVAAAYVMYYR